MVGARGGGELPTFTTIPAIVYDMLGGKIQARGINWLRLYESLNYSG